MQYHALSAALALCVLAATPAYAATQFTLSFDPVAYDNSTKDAVLGEGHLTGKLDGNNFTVSGNFSGLSSEATMAHLGAGLDFGVPGDFFTDLTVTHAPSGTITGTVILTPAQVAALNKRALFLQLDSVKGKDGSLWGWFEPVRSKK